MNGSKTVAQMPKMNDKSFYYFEHRSGSRNDVKLLQLDESLGDHIGYALYFKALEVMLELEKPVLRLDSAFVAKTLGVSISQYKLFLESAISAGLFDIDDAGNVYSPAFTKWLRTKQIRSEVGSKGGSKTQANRQANDQVSDQVNDQVKPKPKPKKRKNPESSDEIKQLRQYVSAIFADYPNCKNARNELTDEQYQRLIDKYGYGYVVDLQKAYFGWKVSKKDVLKTTDYGVLNRDSSWVHEKVGKRGNDVF
jgi:hypothetical protein